MQVFKSLAKETIFYGLSYSLGRLLNFLLVTTYLTHKVFVAEDGSLSLYQDIYFYIALLLGLLTLRMETGLFRFLSDEKSDSQSIYALLSQIVWLSCLVFILLLWVFQKEAFDFLAYPSDYKNCIFLACGIIVLDVVTSLPFAKMRYDKKAKRYAWIKLFGILVNIGLVIFFFELYLNSSQLTNLAGQSKIYFILLANLISSGVIFILLLREFIQGFKLADWSVLKKIFQYTWPLITITAIFTIIQNGYTSFLKFLLPGSTFENLQASDQLNATVRLAVIMNIFITAFNYAAEPFFFRHSKEDDARLNYARLNLFFVIACSIIYILTCTNLSLVSNFIGPGYRNSLPLLSVLLLGNIFYGIYTNFSSWYKLTDNTLMAAGISFLGLILNIILFIFLTPRLGTSSAAWIFLIVNIVMCVFSYIQGAKYYPIPYELSKILAYLLVAIGISYLHNQYIHMHPLLNIIVSIIYSASILYYAYKVEWKTNMQLK
ncbi:MAG: hypothetical protein HOP11_14000 [Saprospiraceae bacterium]|nr:hypothetical protein [Saprospiraceae bacterium]